MKNTKFPKDWRESLLKIKADNKVKWIGCHMNLFKKYGSNISYKDILKADGCSDAIKG